ncbi:MAG: CBS domain-containing protein [Alphaproteobacteria bacterium]|nr:CBS domain-containing protein [Alphaproteobacteria bacterium]
MKAADVMTRSVITVRSETSVVEAARLMLQHRISGLPVVGEGGVVVGIVTENNLLRRTETGTARHRSRWLEFLTGPERLARDYVEANARKVSEVMTRQVVSVMPHTPLAEVVALMEKHRVKRLPVMEAGSLAGIVSRADLVQALVDKATSPMSRSYGDEEIRERILAAIAAEPWSPRFDVSVWVRDGIVDLGGTYTNEHECAALKVLVENTLGVKEVRDRLVRVEPALSSVLPPAGSPPTIR